MTHTRIRHATANDFEDIRRLLLALAEGFRIPAPEQDAKTVFFAQLDDPSSEVLVAQQSEGEVTGVITLRYFSAINLGGTQAYIAELSVHPDHRRRGIGRQLLDAAIGRARERGCRLVEVKTHPKRLAALGLYGSAGMHETCRVLELPLTDTARMALPDH